jgi:hypothetical protein
VVVLNTVLSDAALARDSLSNSHGRNSLKGIAIEKSTQLVHTVIASIRILIRDSMSVEVGTREVSLSTYSLGFLIMSALSSL